MLNPAEETYSFCFSISITGIQAFIFRKVDTLLAQKMLTYKAFSIKIRHGIENKLLNRNTLIHTIDTNAILYFVQLFSFFQKCYLLLGKHLPITNSGNKMLVCDS